MTSAGGLVPVAVAAELPVALLLSGPAGGVRGRGRGRRGVRVPGRGVVRHGRHEHRRVPRSAAACPSRRRCTRSPASRSATRRSTSTRSAPAAGRSPGSTPAARSSSGPRAPARCPGPACYGRGGHRADGHRRRPRARPHPGRHRVPRAGPARRRRGARRDRPGGRDRRGRRAGRRRRRWSGRCGS